MKKTRLYLFLPIATFMLLHLLQSQPAMAQKTFRATISKIASVENGKKHEIKEETDKVQYKRHRAPDWVKAKKEARLYDRDRVLIRPDTYVMLEMKGSTVGATFTLWGDTSKPTLRRPMRFKRIRSGSVIMRFSSPTAHLLPTAFVA